MRSLKRRIAVILTIVLTLTSVPYTGLPVNAAPLREDGADILLTGPESLTDETIVSEGIDLAQPDRVIEPETTFNTGDVSEDANTPEYKEGSVIVCVSTGKDHPSVTGDEIPNDRAAVTDSLLDSADELMDVTEAVKESEESADAGDNSGDKNGAEGGISNDKATDDGEYTLKYIHSDSYSTQQMIEMLEADPDVLFAEPDYIYHGTDDELLKEETIRDETLPAKEISGIPGVGHEEEISEATGVGNEERIPEISDADNADKICEVSDADNVEKIPEISDKGNEEKISGIPDMDNEDKISENSDAGDEEDIRNISHGEADEEVKEELPRDMSEGFKPDLTGRQYAYLNGPGGMDVPYWNNESHRNAEDTVVAVLDSGVDYEHEDLKDVMWDEGLLYPELTKLGGGRYGYNAIKEDSKEKAYRSNDPMDDNSHGTHCAGSVGAPWNGYGVSGTANGTRIMAVKAGNDKNDFAASDILKAFNYIKTAKEVGVNVVAVNNSWGGPAYANAFNFAVRELNLDNVICCFASGNESIDMDYTYKTTSNMRENDGLICVNSNDVRSSKSTFSNYGVRSADVSAPGTAIMSTVPTELGKPDPLTSAPVIDSNGHEVKDDFGDDTTYFSYGSMGGSNVSFAQDDGKRVLKINNMSNNEYILTLSGNSLGSKPEYFALSAKYDKDVELALLVYVRTRDGKYKECVPTDYLTDFYSFDNVYRLPDDMDLDHPVFQIFAFFKYGAPSATDALYINGVSLTNERSKYGIMSGTSMATPAVTGEVAVIASRWPHDSAGRRAARVIASTVPRDELKDTSRTGGVANLRKALACDYSPVVNKAWIDEEGLLNLSGYFFGPEEGRVAINSSGADIEGCTVREWKGLGRDEWDDDGKNGEDIIKLDPGTNEIPVDEIKVTVSANSGRSGSRWLTVGGTDRASLNNTFYSRLPVPSPDDGKLYEGFERMLSGSGAALDGSIYYTGYKIDSENEIYCTWKYTLSADGITSGWTETDQSLKISNVSNICAYNGMLIYMDGDTPSIRMYSPKDNMIYNTGLSVPSFAGTLRKDVRFVNAGNELYLLLTLQTYDDDKKEYVDNRTELYRLDLAKKELLHLYTLKSVQNSSAISAVKDDKGKVTLISLNKKDESHIEREKITINEDLVSSNAVTIELPGGATFDEQALAGANTQYGIVFTGPCDHSDNADNFLYNPGDDSIVKLRKQIAPNRPVRTIVTEYKGNTYFLGINMYEQSGSVFVKADNDEFRRGSEHKEPLHYYGDDKTGEINDIQGTVYLEAPNNGKVPIGKSIKITPKIMGKDGRQITYIWFIEDAMIATVDQSGRVTGKAGGSTLIGVMGRDSAGNVYKGVYKVTVYSPTTGIKLSSNKLTVKGGSKFDLSAVLTPVNVFREGVEWTVSTPASYPGVIEKTHESSTFEAYSATFKTQEVGEDVQVKVTARAVDGSNKSATCLVTIAGPAPEPPEIKVPVKSAALSDTGTISLGAGMEHEISLVRISPAECSGYSVEWKSSSDAVTVSADKADASRAVIKANKKGTSKISAVITNTVTGGKKTVTVKGLTVKVEPSPLSGNEIRIFNKKEDITGSVSGNRLEVRKSLSLKSSVYSDSVPVRSNKAKVLWSSSDPSVATVTNGKVNAYKEGEVTFTAILVPAEGQGTESVKASCTFYVYNPIRELKLSTKTVQGVREIQKYTDVSVLIMAKHTTAPESKDDTVREKKTYAWTSSDPSVVEIEKDEDDEDSDEVYVRCKKTGKAVITCKALDGSKKSVKCNVTVYESVSGIKITAGNLGTATVDTYNAKEITVRGLGIKKTFTISPNLEPADASFREVTYASSNPAAVTVNKKGQVKRVGEGSADIYVTSVSVGYTAVCHVTK